MSDHKSTAQKLADLAAMAQSLAEEANNLTTEDVDVFEYRLNVVEDSVRGLDECTNEHQGVLDQLNIRLDELESIDPAIDPVDYEDFKNLVEDDVEEHEITINALSYKVVQLEADREIIKARLDEVERLLARI